MKAHDLIDCGLYTVAGKLARYNVSLGVLRVDGGINSDIRVDAWDKAVQAYYKGVWVEVWPLRLTDAMLEQNGWMDFNDGLHTRGHGKQPIWLHFNGYEFCGVGGIEYVHELQMLLFLVGCESVAANFQAV